MAVFQPRAVATEQLGSVTLGSLVTRMLYLFHLPLIRPPTLIVEPYPLISPPEHGHWGPRTPLLRHRNVEDQPHVNLLCHTGVEAGDIIRNRLHPRFL